MLETWRDSWFEEGARLFYVLPQSATEALLPMQMDPKPASLARVFVGRVEIVTPEIETEVANAILLTDRTVLRKVRPLPRTHLPYRGAPTRPPLHNEGKIRSCSSQRRSAAACTIGMCLDQKQHLSNSMNA